MLKTVSFLYKTLSMAAIASYPAVFQAQNGCFSGLSFNRLSMKEFGNPFSRKQLFLLTTLRNGRPKQLILVTKQAILVSKTAHFVLPILSFVTQKPQFCGQRSLFSKSKMGSFVIEKYTLWAFRCHFFTGAMAVEVLKNVSYPYKRRIYCKRNADTCCWKYRHFFPDCLLFRQDIL